VTFLPGQFLKPVAIVEYPDFNDEPDESVIVQITSVTTVGATVVLGPHSIGTGTILTDE
jgi:hypothetical protein